MSGKLLHLILGTLVTTLGATSCTGLTAATSLTGASTNSSSASGAVSQVIGSQLSSLLNIGDVIQSSTITSTGSINLAAQATDSDGTPGVFIKYVFSAPIPANAQVTGMHGRALINGMGSGLSMALFSVWYVPSGKCVANGTQYSDYTKLFTENAGAQPLGTFIVKTYGNGAGIVNTNVNFPVSFPASGCALVVLDGGAPVGGSVSMTSSIKLNYFTTAKAVTPANAPQMIDVSDEFCFNSTPGNCGRSNTLTTESFVSSRRVTTSGTLLGLFGSESQGLAIPPSGAWGGSHAIYIDHACSQMAPGDYGPGHYFEQIPANATMLLTLNLQDTHGTLYDLQSQIVHPLYVGINAGDCLVHVVHRNGPGDVDAETQIHAILVPGAAPARAALSSAPKMQMYRLYNPTLKLHLQSNRTNEAVEFGYVYEGPSFTILSGGVGSQTQALYRCNSNQSHYFSNDPACEGGAIDGFYGTVYNQFLPGTIPLYRFSATNGTPDHFETGDINEGLANGYQMDGLLGYALPSGAK